MTSSIDANNPESGAATTQSVRDNFEAAKDEIEAALRMFEDAVTTTGSSNAYSASFSVQPVLTDNPRLTITANFTSSSTTPTLTVNDTLTSGAKTLKNSDGTALVSGDIVSGGVYDVWYDGTDWLVMNGNRLQSALDTAEAAIDALEAEDEFYPHDAIGGLEFTITTDDTSNDSITIAAGSAYVTDQDCRLASAMQKNMTDAWVAGTGNGGVGSTIGTPLTADTRYNVYMISQSGDATQIDFICSDSAANAITDAGGSWDRSRLVGYFRTGATATALRNAFRISNPGERLQIVDRFTASSDASITISDITYSKLFVEIVNLVPATDDVELFFRVGLNGTIDSGASAYAWSNHVFYSGTGEAVNTADSKIELIGASGSNDISNVASEGGVCGELNVVGLTAAAATIVYGRGLYPALAGEVFQWQGAGRHLTTSAQDDIQILFNSGNIASGEVIVYGVA